LTTSFTTAVLTLPRIADFATGFITAAAEARRGDYDGWFGFDSARF